MSMWCPPGRGRLIVPSRVRAVATVTMLAPMTTAIAVVAHFGPSVPSSVIVAACICVAAVASNRLAGWAYRVGRKAEEVAAFDLAELALLDRHLDEVDPFPET